LIQHDWSSASQNAPTAVRTISARNALTRTVKSLNTGRCLGSGFFGKKHHLRLLPKVFERETFQAVGINKIARKLGIGVSVVQRVLK